HLDAEARRAWKWLCKELAGMGLLTKADKMAMAALCALWSRWAKAEAAMAREGGPVLAGDQSGIMNYYSAWYGVSNKALQLTRRYFALFGLSPSDRAKLAVAPPVDADPFDDFLK